MARLEPEVRRDPPARPLGIVAALPQELAGLIAAMRADPAMRTLTAGRREYYAGELWGTRCVLTLARVGKVAAAATTAALIHRFDVAAVVFTGVAGAAAPHVRVGDIVLADGLMQHDMDASPLFPRYQIPLLDIDHFPTDKVLTDRLARAAQDFLHHDRCAPDAANENVGHVGHLSHVGRIDRAAPGSIGLESELGGKDQAGVPGGTPALHRGLILSGDRFIADKLGIAALRQALPQALAVEMEGAAAAQVCYEYGVPCAVVRSISDGADADAAASFSRFLEQVASRYSYGILQRFLAHED